MDKTIMIDTNEIRVESDKNTLKEIIKDMNTKYNSYKQITEYLLSGDIGYITSYKDCRNRIQSINRRDLIEEMLKEFIKWEY